MQTSLSNRFMGQNSVDAKCDPPAGGMGTRGCQMHIVAEMKGQVDPLHRALDRHSRDFTVPLYSMSITHGEECFRYSDWQIESTAGHQFFAVDIATTKARWKRGVNAWLIGMHPHDAHERT